MTDHDDTNRGPGMVSADAAHLVTEPDGVESRNVLSSVEVHATSFGHLFSPRSSRTMVADIVLDVRWHFRNPLHDDEMRQRTGLHVSVRDFVLATPGVRELIAATVEMVKVMAAVAHRPVTVAVGGGGGRHRGPAIVEELTDQLRQAGALLVTTEHLDVDQDVVDHTNPDNWDSPPELQHTGGPRPS